MATAKDTATATTPPTPRALDPDTAAKYDALTKLASEDRPTVWAPHAPNSTDEPTIVGEFIRMEYGTSDYGSHGIMILKTDDVTLRSVWLLHDVLRNEMMRLRPNTGDIVAIRYLGKVRGEKREYIGWRVEVDRARAQVVDWDSVGRVARDGEDD